MEHLSPDEAPQGVLKPAVSISDSRSDSPEPRRDSEPDPTPGNETDTRDQFARWFADWWLRRGRRLAGEADDTPR
jgi:hypothetical protein